MNIEKDTKRAILQKGLEMASHLSLGTITIGELAKEMKMSKSGLFAHFNSKEKLQLDILDYAAHHFASEVILPALKVERGIPRIRAIVKNWVGWGSKFNGGCIFINTTTEFNDRPGKIRDLLFKQQNQWLDILKRICKSAVKVGDLKTETECEQFAFDLYSLVFGAYFYDQLIQNPNIELRIENSLNQFLKTYSK